MIVLITGGAAGLGESITRRLAQEANSKIYFTYSNSDANAKTIVSEFNNVFSIKCDFRNLEEVNSLQNKIAEINIDVLINNAYLGTFIDKYFHKTDSIDFLSNFKENIIPTILITQSALTLFRKKKCGKIITVLTSALVNTPPIGSSVYIANKAYLEELTKIWAVENIKFNITSNSVSPSFMITNLTNNTDERIIEQIIETHPLKKLLSTNEVADTISFLCHASEQINGINIVLNAGVSIK